MGKGPLANMEWSGNKGVCGGVRVDRSAPMSIGLSIENVVNLGLLGFWNLEVCVCDRALVQCNFVGVQSHLLKS